MKGRQSDDVCGNVNLWQRQDSRINTGNRVCKVRDGFADTELPLTKTKMRVS